MRIINDVKLDFDDVLIQPKRSTIASRREVDLHRTFNFKHSKASWSGLPIVSSNMNTVTTFPVWCEIQKKFALAALPKNVVQDYLDCVKLGQFVDYPYDYTTIGTLGINTFLEDAARLLATLPELRFLCIDVANGYMERLADDVHTLHSKYPRVVVMAGNVVTPEMTEALILAGADIVKVGIGSGSACTTRIITGVGYPQLSAIIECADAAHGLGGHIMSDGGCVTPGDVAKAFGAGADFVMLGGMLAGHDENGTKFYGMSSATANEIHAGGLRDYRAAEGKELELEPRGPIAKTLQEIEGGLRSACSYVGARKLKDLPKCTTFIRVNRILNTSLD
jgi:GMP reductase